MTTEIETEEFPLSELAERLRAAWEEHRRKVQKPVVRVASFNLLVVSAGETDPELAAIVDGLQTSHPCRLIWTKLKPEKAWSESTGALSVLIRCGGQQVCSEQLILRCGNDRPRIPSLVLPLIHSGLPTHLLWWKAGPLDCPLFRRLQDRSRVALWEPDIAPSNFSLEYLERLWSDPYQFEHAVYPLDWYRILGRRRSIASAYDRGPVDIMASEPAAEMSLANRLLQGWIQSRLGSSSSEVRFRWTSGPLSCCLEQPEPREIPLLDDLQATRLALDYGERDPVFLETLQAVLAAKRR
jgi:glucose-6-phosphate dehydrogenase assembly protein OpcA